MDFFSVAEMFFKYMMGQRSLIGERSQEISVEILNQIRRVLILVVVTLGALTMFCMGMSHLIERVLNKLDEGGFYFTTSIGVILVFIFICVGVIVYSTNKNVWLSIFKKEKIAQAPSAEAPSTMSNTLESVITLLVMDFVKEREANRATKTSTAPKAPTSDEHI